MGRLTLREIWEVTEAHPSVETQPQKGRGFPEAWEQVSGEKVLKLKSLLCKQDRSGISPAKMKKQIVFRGLGQSKVLSRPERNPSLGNC